MSEMALAIKIFINYRHSNAAFAAGRIRDHLVPTFGLDNLFMDVDNIPLGANFVVVLGEKVAECDVLLAIMDVGWVSEVDGRGNRRLDSPDDYVRNEIAAALKRDIPVIPIVLDDACVPQADHLPPGIKDLAFRNALNIRHASFPSDMEKLIRCLSALKPVRRRPWPVSMAPSVEAPPPSDSGYPLSYLSNRDSELGPAIIRMARQSAWGRWYAAQHLAMSGAPIGLRHLFQTAAGQVMEEITNGTLEVRGRCPDPKQLEYEPIDRTHWRSSWLLCVPDPKAQWKIKLIPRGDYVLLLGSAAGVGETSGAGLLPRRLRGLTGRQASKTTGSPRSARRERVFMPVVR